MSTNAALEQANYYGDSRVVASLREHAYTVARCAVREVLIELHDSLWDEDWEDEDFEEVPRTLHQRYHTVSAEFEVCPLCRGTGMVVSPGIDCGGLSQEDFEEDPDFAEAYFGGSFDRQCTKCKGNRVTLNGTEAVRSLPSDVQAAIAGLQAEFDSDLRDRIQELQYGY